VVGGKPFQAQPRCWSPCTRLARHLGPGPRTPSRRGGRQAAAKLWTERRERSERFRRPPRRGCPRCARNGSGDRPSPGRRVNESRADGSARPGRRGLAHHVGSQDRSRPGVAVRLAAEGRLSTEAEGERFACGRPLYPRSPWTRRPGEGPAESSLGVSGPERSARMPLARRARHAGSTAVSRREDLGRARTRAAFAVGEGTLRPKQW